MPDDFSASPIEPTEASRIQKQEQMDAKKMAIAQEASQINMIQYADEAAFNPVMMAKRFQTLEEKLRKKALEKEDAKKADEKTLTVEQVEEIADSYEKRNPELTSKSLQQLLAQLKSGDNPQDVLRKAMQNFPDHSLADEALEFLEKSTKGDLHSNVRQAKDNLNETYGREVRAGRNMGAEARDFSQKGLGSPTGLRDLYREITGNPRPATQLFGELNEKFTYAKMEKAIDFILHSMGADLKSKGPSIAPGQLHTLMSEARNLLAILWIYRFFKGRMDLITAAFERAGMLLPSRITFEMLAKMFVAFLMERYPSMDKVFQLSLKMGISADILAQIILFGQMRDAVRGVAPKLFRTEQHRHDILMSFLEALEELEEQMEEEEEEEHEGEEE
ncbi:MAG: type III secretion system gatekeeper subunit SctW [Simkaniaceae bacterium]|nr:type III secretion system gatekeeper subunit SctW [Candidatus Sacchlamyda saccharinae]